jgi:hypothetical protein
LVTPEGKLLKTALFSLGLIRSLLIVVVVATVVAFLGLRLAEGEPPPPRTGTLSTPVPPDPSPEPAISEPPSSITIAGQEVALAPGMRYSEGGVSSNPPPGPPREIRTVRYDPDPATQGNSWLSLDEEGRLGGSHIRPEDLAVFQPLLDAALPRLPTTATIAGKEFTLAPGMRAGQLLPARNSTTRVWCIYYTSIPAKPAMSLLCVDQDWNTVRNEVDPDDLAVYQPLLDSVTSELPESVVINGHEVWPLPGAALVRVIDDCPPASVTTDPCRDVTYTIRRSGTSFIIFDEEEIITENLAPEDRADFQPILDALE